jgi:hypothetical protein
MANIRLKELLEANVNPKLVARSKESGKLVYFKTPQAKDAALKAGSHLDPKAEKGAQPKVDTKPNNMFGADYKKDRGAETPKNDVDISDYSTDGTSAVLYKGKKVGDYMYDDITDEFTLKTKDGIKAFDSHADMYNYIEKNKDGGAETPKDNTDWMDDLDSIDTSDIKGKADPDADSFTHDDVFGATFKDPQTGKTITVGDAYEREDDSPAYQKAFAYVAKFDPDKEAVMGTQAYDDLNKKDDTDWMDDLDSIDTSDIKGKADPNADSFTSNDLYGATFKDPETGKTITVGDAYEREDDSEAYKKAFAYVSKFDPDKEAVMGTQAYDDLNKKSEPTLNINPKNWKKTDGDGRMSSESADDVRNYLNDVLGVDGMAEVDFGSGNIQYGLADGENSIFVGNDGGTYNVSFEGPSMDFDKIEQSYKSFKNPKDALLYAGELAKANRKGLEQKQESTKLTSMIKRK